MKYYTDEEGNYLCVLEEINSIYFAKGVQITERKAYIVVNDKALQISISDPDLDVLEEVKRHRVPSSILCVLDSRTYPYNGEENYSSALDREII